MSTSLTGNLNLGIKNSYLAVSHIMVISVFILLNLFIGCADIPDFEPLNPCDPEYQGDEVCNKNGDDNDAGDTVCLTRDGDLKAGWCLIGNICMMGAEEDQLDTCRFCNPRVTPSNWSLKEDGNSCTVTNSNSGDSTVGAYREGTCLEGTCIPNNGDECACEEETTCCDGCNPINVDGSCDDDTLSCTKATCTAEGVCEESILDGWCLVNGGTACANTLTDSSNCGQCGNGCDEGYVCTSGECVLDCLSGQLICNNACVDPMTNHAHCGQCNNQCPQSKVCEEGECSTNCSAGNTNCNGNCVNVVTNPDHCGECFNKCGVGSRCESGYCVARVTGVSLDSESITLGIGETAYLTATIEPADAANRAVTWRSADPTVASVDSSGLVTGLAVGRTEITVTTAEGARTASTRLDVKRSVTSVTLAPAQLNLTVGAYSTLTAQVQPANATDPSVSWSSTKPAVASVDQQGNVTALSEGQTTVIVMTTDNALTAHCVVTVTEVKVTGIVVSPDQLSLNYEEQVPLQAEISPEHAPNKAIIWSSSNRQVASVAANGLVTGTGPGQTTITATALDGGHAAHCPVTVRMPVTGIELSHETIPVHNGGTAQLTANILPVNASNKSVTWSSANIGIARVNNAGLVTGVAVGETVVTATTQDGNFVDTAVVIVKTPVSSVSVNPVILNLQPGERRTLTVTISPADATDQRVSWESSRPDIATVSQTGEVTGLSNGSATVSVSTVDGRFTANAAVQVGTAVTGVSLEPSQFSISKGETVFINATVQPPDAGNQNIIWSSSNPAIARVNNMGLLEGVAGGRAEITATTVDGGLEAQADVLVATGEDVWARHFSGTARITPTTVRVDVAENVIVAGYLQGGGANFGGQTCTTTTNGSAQFVAKYSAAGLHIWSKCWNPSQNEFTYVKDLDTDDNGNVYFLGYFSGSYNNSSVINYGTGQITAPADKDRLVIVKLNGTNGTCIYANSFGTDNSSANSITVGEQYYYVTGGYTSSINFGGGTRSGSSNYSLFLAKFNLDGTYVWDKTISSSNYLSGEKIVLSYDESNIILSSIARGNISIGGKAHSNGSVDIDYYILCSYNTDGNINWSNSFSSLYYFGIGNLISTADNNLMLVTSARKSSLTYNGQALNGSASSIGFIKMNLGGDILWNDFYSSIGIPSIGITSINNTSGNYVAVGSVYAAGDSFNEFASIYLGGQSFSGYNSDIKFIVKYNDSRKHLWSKSLSSSSDYFNITAVAMDDEDYSYAGAYFGGTASFGGETFTSSSSHNGLLIKFKP